MSAFLIHRGDDVVGYLTDRELAQDLDGREIVDVVDGVRERRSYSTEEVTNDDVF